MIPLSASIVSKLMRDSPGPALVATRDVSGFAGCGIEVKNPWALVESPSESNG